MIFLIAYHLLIEVINSMFKIYKKIFLHNRTYDDLLDFLKNSFTLYNFVEHEGKIVFKNCGSSFGLYFNSFLLDGEIQQICHKYILCTCSLKPKTKQRLVLLNGFIAFLCLVALTLTPKDFPTLFPVFLLMCMALNLFAYLGLFFSSLVFLYKLKNKLREQSDDGPKPLKKSN